MNQFAPVVIKPDATYQDVLDAPEHMVAEILNGALHLQPRPAFRHSIAASSLADELISPFQKAKGGPGGWVITAEPELHLSRHVLVPDLAGWRRSALEELDVAWVETPPEWVCEVLSPSTRTYDLTEMRDIYAAQGVKYLWLVDPYAKTLEAFFFGEGAWTLTAALHDDSPVSIAPFEAISFPLKALWL